MSKFIIKTLEGPVIEYETDGSKLSVDGEELKISPDVLAAPKTSHGKILRILLGTRCNYDCAYCSQAKSRTGSEDTSIRDVEVFLERVPPLLEGVSRVELWGGEPLVYIKHLKKLVPSLRKLLPDALFTMVSNGSLLTDEIGDFLAENRICYTISHDSYGHKTTRGNDPLDDPEKVACIRRTFKKINDAQCAHYGRPFVSCCGFNLVLTKYCLDPVKAQKWLNEKVGEDVVVSCDPVMGMGNGEGNSSLKMQPEDFDLLSANVFRAGMSAPGEYPYTIADDGMRFIRCIYDGRKLADAEPFCGVSSSATYVIDLKGNLYPCQNFIQRTDVRSNAFESGLSTPKTVSYRTKECCTNCPFVMLCRGGCPLAKGNGFVDTCEMKFAYLKGLFASAIARVTGLTPVKIEGRIVRPVRELIETSHGKTLALLCTDIPRSLSSSCP